MRTEQELIAEGNAVQDACNLSGVVYSFSGCISDLWVIANREEKGTDWVNTHKMCKLFANKIQSLAGELE